MYETVERTLCYSRLVGCSLVDGREPTDLWRDTLTPFECWHPDVRSVYVSEKAGMEHGPRHTGADPRWTVLDAVLPSAFLENGSAAFTLQNSVCFTPAIPSLNKHLNYRPLRPLL